MRPLLSLLMLIAPSLSLAHPGHDQHSALGYLHFVTSPDHLALLAGGVLVVVLAVVGIRARRKLAKLRIS